MNIALASIGVAVSVINGIGDTPHEQESRPNHAELCWTSSSDRYPLMLVEVPGKPARIMPVELTGAPSRSESVFDVSPFNQPGTTVSSAIWVEIARVDSHVCDATGTIIAYAKVK